MKNLMSACVIVAAGLSAAAASAAEGPYRAEAVGVPAGREAAFGSDGGFHTVVWWCVDLNELWRLDVPVIVGAGVLIPPNPSPLPPCPTVSTFPVMVPAETGWNGGGAAIWYMHTHYTQELVEALEATGYHFVSNSPTQDLLQKMTEVRYVVRSVPSNQIVAEHSFDPRQTVRLVRAREFYGDLTIAPTVIPELGINLDSDAMGRLPLVHFAAVGGGLPPGTYRVQVFFVLSELHNDGLGLSAGNFFAAGTFLWAQPLFVVVP